MDGLYTAWTRSGGIAVGDRVALILDNGIEHHAVVLDTTPDPGFVLPGFDRTVFALTTPAPTVRVVA